MQKPVIELQGVEKTYRMGEVEVKAVRGVSLKVMPREFIAFMGASGSGKSTLMHLVGCLDTPTKGKVFLEGRDVSRLTENQLAKVRGEKIGFVFQKFNLINSMSAFENVELPLVFRGMPESVRRKRVEGVLEAVGLGKRAGHKPTELSGGEQQRVAIARALVGDPEVVLADEPTGNLDSKTGKEIMDILIGLNEGGGKTVVLVTHDHDVGRKAKKIIRIMDGKIVGG